jgi:hypothetical protein
MKKYIGLMICCVIVLSSCGGKKDGANDAAIKADSIRKVDSIKSEMVKKKKEFLSTPFGIIAQYNFPKNTNPATVNGNVIIAAGGPYKIGVEVYVCSSNSIYPATFNSGQIFAMNNQNLNQITIPTQNFDQTVFIIGLYQMTNDAGPISTCLFGDLSDSKNPYFYFDQGGNSYVHVSTMGLN